MHLEQGLLLASLTTPLEPLADRWFAVIHLLLRDLLDIGVKQTATVRTMVIRVTPLPLWSNYPALKSLFNGKVDVAVTTPLVMDSLCIC